MNQVIRSIFTAVLLVLGASAADLHVPSEYPSIQAAVDAAVSGDVIRIAAGDYYEQALIVDKENIALAGEPGTVIHATTSMRRILESFGSTTYPILAMVRSEVMISGITFEGERLGNAYPNELFGIIFRGSGGRVENCTMRGFRGVTSTDARAINTINLVSFGTEVVGITIRNNTFSDNYRSVVLGDDPNYPSVLRTRFTIEENDFTGLGPDSTQAHLGVSISTGSGGDCRDNMFTGYSYRGSATGFSAGIRAQDRLFSPTRGFIPVQPVRYEGNRFLTNDHGLVIANANNSQVVSNIFEGTAGGVVRWGSLALSGTNVLVEGNQFSDTPIGIELFGGEMEEQTLRGVATNPRLLSNRFCTVAEPIHVQPLANGIDEQGTAVCSNPPPPRVLNVPADYSTIQGAVSAAKSGDTIRIAPGDYREQIVIANKGRLTLAGDPGSVIHATTSMTDTLEPYNWPNDVALLGIYRSDVMVNGLAFEGGQLGDLYSRFRGIYYLGAGGEATSCTIHGFRGSASTASGAVGIYSDNSVKTGSPAVSIKISDSRFENNELSIQLRGDPVDNPDLLRNTFIVEGNTVVGWGPAALAMDGVVIRNGVSGKVLRNIIRDHAYTGTGDPFSSGIAAHDGRASVRGYYVPLFPIRYEGNTFLNNDEHLVIVGGNDSEVVNNAFLGAGPNESRWGGLAVSGSNVTIANNNFSDMAVGTVLFGDEHFFNGWPRITPAASVTLFDNWFCMVATPIVSHPGMTGLVEQGTERCETRPFQPLFRSVSNGNGSVEMTLRAWQGQSVVIEASTDLLQWLPIQTNATLPTVVFRDVGMGNSARRFYRAVYR